MLDFVPYNVRLLLLLQFTYFFRMAVKTTWKSVATYRIEMYSFFFVQNMEKRYRHVQRKKEQSWVQEYGNSLEQGDLLINSFDMMKSCYMVQ